MERYYENADAALVGAAKHIMESGDEVGSRLGERVQEVLHAVITLERPLDREILVPGRKASLAAQVFETAWVLAGRDDVAGLLPYLPRAKDFSDNGTTWRGAYGPRLRAWTTVVDQLDHVVRLLQEEPLSRRAVVNLYDPAVDTEGGKDIPCNNWISFKNRLGALHMVVSIRSNDLIWGWSGINQFEWSVLQELVAHLVGVDVGQATYVMDSLHVYDRHWSKAREIGQTPVPTRLHVEGSPRIQVSSLLEFDRHLRSFFELEQAMRTEESPSDWATQVSIFPEPMLRSWLHVLAHHWTGDMAWLAPLAGTRLGEAALLGPHRGVHQEPQPDAPVRTTPLREDFVRYVTELHDRKHEAYGDSWKRRGEYVGILANIARKVDRLGKTTDDETELDTAIDLLVYLAKYRVWQRDLALYTNDSDSTTSANHLVRTLTETMSPADDLSTSTLMTKITEAFGQIERFSGANGGKPDLGGRSSATAFATVWAWRLAFRLYCQDKTRTAGRNITTEYLGADHD